MLLIVHSIILIDGVTVAAHVFPKRVFAFPGIPRSRSSSPGAANGCNEQRH